VSAVKRYIVEHPDGRKQVLRLDEAGAKAWKAAGAKVSAVKATAASEPAE
jgi:hypothetical protein